MGSVLQAPPETSKQKLLGVDGAPSGAQWGPQLSGVPSSWRAAPPLHKTPRERAAPALQGLPWKPKS